LFKNPNLNKWDISAEDLKQVDKGRLTKDKEYAFKFMMSKVNFITIDYLQILKLNKIQKAKNFL
jgi:hypothetical protein